MENQIIEMEAPKDKILTISRKENIYDNMGISIEILPNNNYLLGIHEIDLDLYQQPNRTNYKLEEIINTSVFPIFVAPTKNYYLTPGVGYIGISTKTEIDKEGNIIESETKRNIIELEENLSYDNVNKILKNKPVPEKYESYIHMIENLKELVEVYNRKNNRYNFFTAPNEIEIIKKEDYYEANMPYTSPAYKLLAELYEIPFEAEKKLKIRQKNLKLR